MEVQQQHQKRWSALFKSSNNSDLSFEKIKTPANIIFGWLLFFIQFQSFLRNNVQSFDAMHHRGCGQKTIPLLFKCIYNLQILQHCILKKVLNFQEYYRVLYCIPQNLLACKILFLKYSNHLMFHFSVFSDIKCKLQHSLQLR